MELLLKLLNEYEDSTREPIEDECEEWGIIIEKPRWSEYEWHLRVANANIVAFDKWTFDSYAFSKRYGFIKRLVENEKINEKNLNRMKTPRYLDSEWALESYEMEDEITMLLSISDNAIRLLISLLK